MFTKGTISWKGAKKEDVDFFKLIFDTRSAFLTVTLISSYTRDAEWSILAESFGCHFWRLTPVILFNVANKRAFIL